MYRDTHIFCCTNYGYIDYTKNFIEYYKRLNTSWRLNVYCMDEKSVEALKDISEIHIIHYPIQDINEDFSKTLLTFIFEDKPSLTCGSNCIRGKNRYGSVIYGISNVYIRSAKFIR